MKNKVHFPILTRFNFIIKQYNYIIKLFKLKSVNRECVRKRDIYIKNWRFI